MRGAEARHGAGGHRPGNQRRDVLHLTVERGRVPGRVSRPLCFLGGGGTDAGVRRGLVPDAGTGTEAAGGRTAERMEKFNPPGFGGAGSAEGGAAEGSKGGTAEGGTHEKFSERLAIPAAPL